MVCPISSLAQSSKDEKGKKRKKKVPKKRENCMEGKLLMNGPEKELLSKEKAKKKESGPEDSGFIISQ